MLLVASNVAFAQSGGAITGVVRDMSANPMANIEVFVFPGDHIIRTDESGHFVISRLEPGTYVVRARRVGLQPVTVSATVPLGGNVDIELRFSRFVPMLDTVVVKGDADCEKHSLNGFMCRRSSARGGVFMDYNDIASRNIKFIGDLYRGIEGFRVDWSGTPRGIVPRPVPITGWRCMKVLVNGWTPMLFNVAPDSISDLMAIEVYADPDDVPEEFQVYTWPKAEYRTVRSRGASRGTPRINVSGRCSLTVYWTFQGLKRP